MAAYIGHPQLHNKIFSYLDPIIDSHTLQIIQNKLNIDQEIIWYIHEDHECVCIDNHLQQLIDNAPEAAHNFIIVIFSSESFPNLWQFMSDDYNEYRAQFQEPDVDDQRFDENAVRAPQGIGQCMCGIRYVG